MGTECCTYSEGWGSSFLLFLPSIYFLFVFPSWFLPFSNFLQCLVQLIVHSHFPMPPLSSYSPSMSMSFVNLLSVRVRSCTRVPLFFLSFLPLSHTRLSFPLFHLSSSFALPGAISALPSFQLSRLLSKTPSIA